MLTTLLLLKDVNGNGQQWLLGVHVDGLGHLVEVRLVDPDREARKLRHARRPACQHRTWRLGDADRRHASGDGRPHLLEQQKVAALWLRLRREVRLQ